MKSIVLAIILLLYTLNALALTGQEFVGKCNKVNLSKGSETPQQAVDRAIDMGTCGGFVGGVVQGINLIGDMLQAQGAASHNFICAPKTLHPMEIVRDVVSYISKEDKFKALPVESAVYASMVLKYPCKMQ